MANYRRKVAFSNKQKKAQLKDKRNRLKKRNCDSDDESPCLVAASSENETAISIPSSNRRYDLKFRKQNKSQRAEHYKPLVKSKEEDFELDTSAFFPDDLSYPTRPVWKPGITPQELNAKEEKYFTKFRKDIEAKYDDDTLSLFELNLETWRQLWRVTEMSDILLIIVDVRYAVAQFPPYLYEELAVKQDKDIILILNKCDLVSPYNVLAWQNYFEIKYPKLYVLPFASIDFTATSSKRYANAFQSFGNLIQVCKDIVGDKVDLSGWTTKLEEESLHRFAIKKQGLVYRKITGDKPRNTTNKYRNGVLTIGTIGFPNVGKSSLINALIGKKVVSVSVTPGHTKHFQTMFITDNVKLCDCPGLVFPSTCPKQLQIIVGSFPVAQVKDPIATVRYIGSKIDIPDILNLEMPAADDGVQWTPFDICEAYARRRSYFARSKGAKPDVHRAANELLRYTLLGRRSLIF